MRLPPYYARGGGVLGGLLQYKLPPPLTFLWTCCSATLVFGVPSCAHQPWHACPARCRSKKKKKEKEKKVKRKGGSKEKSRKEKKGSKERRRRGSDSSGSSSSGSDSD